MDLSRLYEDINFTHAIIDGDLIVYTGGFGAKPGEPVENALHNCKSIMARILEFCGAPEYRLFLTGKDNFRDIVAVTKPYKGNRDTLHKPEHYQACRDYLVNAWAAEVVDGMEADDACAITQYQHLADANPILVSVDKDLNMIPGWHYNWKKDESKFIDQDEADKWFWFQLCTGDTVDNIAGLPGIGEKKAERMLEGKSLAEMEQVVREAYRSMYPNGDEVFREMANLLWMLREPPNGELRW